MSKIIGTLQTISDQGNTLISKLFVYAGVSGSSVGVASGFAKTVSDNSSDFLTLTEWGSVCGIVGGLTLAAKSGSDIYFNRKREKREQELHEMKLKGDK